MSEEPQPRAAKIHALKTETQYFEAVWIGHKTAEFRLNDRDYRVGDTLRLLEYDSNTATFSERHIDVRVTHVCDLSPLLAPSDISSTKWVMLSFGLVKRYSRRPVTREDFLQSIALMKHRREHSDADV